MLTVKLCCVPLFLLTAATALQAPELRQFINECEQNTDCNPSTLGDLVSPSEVVCNNGQCSCSGCFMNDTTTNRCYLPPCTYYKDNGCIDKRQKQSTAFQLALFSTWVGAANFYIKRYEFAVPQLIVGIILCATFCISSRFFKECNKHEQCQACACFCCCFCTTCLLLLLFIASWIYDLVCFYNNCRVNGDGCPLIKDLTWDNAF